ncbi:acyltransferase family protein [Noviherbaspirillum sp.]|uniref:acyltransferase family protein n=1 Tax=Noviherbaspirillum sp. TaxID=1926288 RepID=UPI002FDF3224
MQSASVVHYRFLDLLKAVASNLIVLHHLAFYGPMVDHVKPVMPELIEWLETQARIAVQVFLVMGGFLAAKSLSPDGMPGLRAPLRAVTRRFIKLVPPFMVAMALAVAGAALAGRWMTHDSIGASPTLAQFAAHGLLLHGVLGYESLSAGAWYVAIDFQLYALLTLLLWLAGRIAGGRPSDWLVPLLVIAGVGMSLFFFNLDADWDAWAPYFLGSYGLGVLAWWASMPGRPLIGAALIAGAMLLLGGLALEMEFRSRIAVALVTALTLVVVYRGGISFSTTRWPLVEYLGRISYAVFLVHFPVCLVINAAFTQFVPHSAWAQGGGMLLAWFASLVVGALFHRWVEIPLGRLVTLQRGTGAHSRRTIEA